MRGLVIPVIARLLSKRSSGARNDPAECAGSSRAPRRREDGDDWRGLDDEQHDAPGGDERHQEQAAQHAQPEALSREGSALRAGQVAQALTLGTARPDAVVVLIEADEE